MTATLGRVIPAFAGEASDHALLGRFLAGRDEAAFATLVRRHGPMVLGMCRRIVGDRHLAEDAFQATFLVLARKAATVRTDGALAAWLFGVARKAALEARRRRRTTRENVVPVVNASARAELAAADVEELSRLDRELD